MIIARKISATTSALIPSIPAGSAMAELNRSEAVVFDPPRQCAQAQAHELAASTVPIVVVVSCNPATFARDARILVDGGYRLLHVTPVDQFLYSAHVELVARFRR
jgi:23S rRNA (uracil1939-C5)-methyltransferase